MVCSERRFVAQRAKGLAERVLTNSPAQSVILCIPPTVSGLQHTWRFRAAHASRRQPLYSADLVNALIAGCTHGTPGTNP